MRVDIELRQSADVDFKLLASRHRGGQCLVEAMDALDDQRRCRRDGKMLRSHLAFPREEVVMRQDDFLAIQQAHEMVIEQLDIECADIFKVIRPVLRARRILPVAEVVVKRDGNRLDAVDAKLDAQALSERGLARRRRPRNQDETQFLDVRCNMIGNLGNLLFVQSLRYMDDVSHLTATDITVEIRYIVTVQDTRPALRLHEDAAELRLLLERRHDLRRARFRRTQQHAARHGIESELIQNARRRHHRAKQIVIKLAAVVKACLLCLKRHDEIRLFNLL